MKTVHFYDLKSGLISHELRISARNAEKLIEANTPVGYAPIFGVSDQLAQKVDIETGRLVDHQPQRPDPDHDWDETRKRWVKTTGVRVRDEKRLLAMQRISDLERRQARRVRELLAESDQQLKLIDDEIADLRVVLSDGTYTSEP